MTSKPLSVTLFATDLAHRLDGARILAEGIANHQFGQDADRVRAPEIIAAIISSVAEGLRALARVSQGEADPSFLTTERVAASAPIDAADRDIRIRWSSEQRIKHLRHLIRQAEAENHEHDRGRGGKILNLRNHKVDQRCERIALRLKEAVDELAHELVDLLLERGDLEVCGSKSDLQHTLLRTPKAKELTELMSHMVSVAFAFEQRGPGTKT